MDSMDIQRYKFQPFLAWQLHLRGVEIGGQAAKTYVGTS